MRWEYGAKLQPVDVGKFVDMLNNVGWYGLIGAYAPCEPDLDFAASYLFTSSSPTGYSKAMLHPAELDENINTSSHADYATRQALYLQQQSMYIDKYCLIIPLVVWPPIAAKSTKLHDEYTCTVESNFPWTFADCWIEK